MTRSFVVAGAIVLASVGAAAAQPRDLPMAEGRRALNVQGQHFGTLPDDHPVTLRVRGVFEKLVRVAGRRPGLTLEAHALDTPRIILEALRGGIVVISRGAVDLAGGDDDALAFLLGHEIAHHVRDHYSLLESLGVLGAGATQGRDDSDQVVRVYHAVELAADRLGVLFAALAGYRAAAAVPMLMTLIERSGPDTFHPTPKKRAEGIRAQVAEVVDHLELFHLGLFMLASGRPLDAAQVLEYFLSLFPSREVLSAVGVAYHREALRHAPAPPFRHVLVVDGASRAPVPRGGTPPAFRQYLERAVFYYTAAAEADPTYAWANSNLAAAHVDLGERELALGYANRALKSAPGLAAAYNNRGVAWALGRDWAQAENDWLAAARLDPRLAQSALNLARLYGDRGQSEDAQRWAARVTATPATDHRRAGVQRTAAQGGIDSQTLRRTRRRRSARCPRRSCG